MRFMHLLVVACCVVLLCIIQQGTYAQDLQSSASSSESSGASKSSSSGLSSCPDYDSTSSSEKDEWLPLRIRSTLAKEYVNPDSPFVGYFCKNPFLTVYDFDGTKRYCTAQEINPNLSGDLSVSRAVSLLDGKLLVQRRPLDVSMTDPGRPCARFLLEASNVHTCDDDFILYQTFRPVGADGKNLRSIVCSLDKNTGRPTSAVINIAAQFPVNTLWGQAQVTQEILHMFGFNTTMFAEKNMVTRATVRGVENVPLVNSPMVLQMARDFYDCPTLPGMELDYDSTKDNTPLPYWRGRVAKDDVMSSAGNMTYVTPMTIAAMEDTGLYKGNYSNADLMPWGYKAGCDFVTQKCMEGGKSSFGNLFCTDGLSSSPTWQCTSDRRAIGNCGMGKASGDLPSPFQYFADATEGGSLSTMDYCPVVQADITTSCTDVSNSTLSQFDISMSTRCFRTQGTGAKYDGKPFNVACLKVKCNSTDLTYTIRLFKDTTDTQTPCPANRKVDVSIVGGGGIFTKGFIRCPPYEQVCVATLNDASAISDQSAGDSAESDDDDSDTVTSSMSPQPQPTTSSDKTGSSKSSESSASQSSSSSSDSSDSTDKPTAPPAPKDAASVSVSKVLALVLVAAMMLMM